MNISYHLLLVVVWMQSRIIGDCNFQKKFSVKPFFDIALLWEHIAIFQLGLANKEDSHENPIISLRIPLTFWKFVQILLFYLPEDVSFFSNIVYKTRGWLLLSALCAKYYNMSVSGMYVYIQYLLSSTAF